MIIQNREHWRTSNELAYVDALASWAWRKWCESPPDITDDALLSNYIKGAEHRKRYKTWGTVEADEVIKRARAHLDKVKG
jgi:hypothetical protein